MATSGLYDYSTSGTNIITDALFKCGGAAEGEDIPSEQITSALRQFNSLVKYIVSKGRNLWRREEVYVFLNPSQPRYLLGSLDTDAEWCLVEAFTATKLNGKAAAAATSLTVDSTKDMRAGDRLGLELTDGTRQWLSIVSIDSATTMTVPASPAIGAASDNATVFTYTTNTEEVVKVRTLVNSAGGHAAASTTLTLDSTTGMSNGDRFSYVATDATTVFSVITTVDNSTTLTVPSTAKAMADNALIETFTTNINQGSISNALNGAASANDETITLDSTAGMVAGDVISVVLTNSSTAWMAIERVVSTAILAIPPLTAAASDNAIVTAYTLKRPRPLRILHARRKEGADGEDVPVDIEAQELYRDQPLKTTNGTPVMVTYKPTLTSGRLEIWQPPSSINLFLGLTVERPFEIFDAAANNPDFPEEWYDPLVWLLADRLEPEYRVLDPVRLQKLSKMAEEMWAWVENFDADMGSIYLQPEEYG